VHGRREQLYVATAEALLLRDGNAWFRYEGLALSENQPDWLAIEPGDIATAQSPLPTVRMIASTDDGSLWLATDQGLARYYARQGRSTILEAYPDLGTGAVNAVHTDDRGMLWVSSTDGLFRFDGRDLAQYDFAQNLWTNLGLAEAVYPDELTETLRGHWRWDRDQVRWEHYDSRLSRFAEYALDQRSANDAGPEAVLFTTSVRADLGTFDGTKFTGSEDVVPDRLVMRLKPNEDRIVAGGLPAVPVYRAGAQWRYLQLEPEPLAVPAAGRPWWSREGRLFPEPQQTGPFPGHFRTKADPWNADGRFDESVFVYPPSALLWMAYPSTPEVGVRIRLFKSSPEQSIDPALVERVWALLVRAKAAGVPLELAVEGSTVKGERL